MKSQSYSVEPIAPGIWRLRLGSPEPVTPATLREAQPCLDALLSLPQIGVCPIDVGNIQHRIERRGICIVIPIIDSEQTQQFFGLGLQLGGLNQSNRKKTLRVNSDPIGNAGDSHAPVPFVVSTAGYGIYVDTARYSSFYLGSHKKVPLDRVAATKQEDQTHTVATSTEELYASRGLNDRLLTIDVPVAQGVDVYFFAGPTPLHVVQRYNLFSGGGCMPPLWGLGIWYRLYAGANQQDVIALAKSLRNAHLACDVLGLEPGWQSHAYSCSFVWDPERFADPDRVIGQLREMNYHVNLWEHVFVHPTSPLYASLKPHAGDYEVWAGLVPDLSVAEARKIFADYHRVSFVEKGITGFKLDECDNSDFIHASSWSFPEASTFPSGLDGEQMHSLLGVLYQQTLNRIFEDANCRIYSSVRSSGAFASSLPYVLYSDLYDHRDFIRGIASSSFAGLLWTPEVRHAESLEDLLRRIQAVVLSPQAVINTWYMKNPPWFHFDRDKNNAGEMLEDSSAFEGEVRKLFQLRMSLIPYIYAAFARYCFDGTPPFRAVALDYPADAATHNLDDQYLMGDDMLIAPIFYGQRERSVHLPTGQWYDFFTHIQYCGGRTHSFPVDPSTMLIFVRSGGIIPIADPVECVTPETVFDITPHAFGPIESLRPAVLFEDDGVSFNFRAGHFNRITIHPDRSVVRTGSFKRDRYRLVGWAAYE